MSKEPGISRSVSTRDRILAAAIRRFAAASYDHTNLRDIAADVGVDVAYVHRSFGSKEKLFHAVLAEIGKDCGIDEVSLDDLARLLTEELFSDHDPGEDAMPDPLLILIHSLTVPSAAGAVGQKLEKLFIQPIQDRLGDSDKLRAAAIMSMLIGLRTMRGLLSRNCVDQIGQPEAAARIRAIIETIIRQPPGGAD